MDPLSQLPLECLEHILQVLDDNDDVASLANLLSMNKYISSVSLPFLYQNPFRHTFYFDRKQLEMPRKVVSVYRAGRRVTRMLLDTLPPTSLLTGLSIAMGVSSTTATTTIRTTTAADASDNDGEVTESHFIFNNSNTTPASPLDYCSHIRHINLEPCFIEVAFPKLHERVLHDSILEYVASKEFDDIFLTQPLSTRYGRLGLNEPGILYSYYLSILQHEVTWCLAFPILEQLQSLTIHHTYSVGQFMKVIGRLESLEEVRFMLIDTHEYIFKDPDWDRWNRYSEEAAWKMVEFVRQHAQEFKGLLKTVHCFNTPYRYDDWGWVGAVKQEIHRILPPLSRPTRLEKDNWERIVAHRNTTDLGHVWEVDGEGMPRLWYDAVCEDNRPILQRCRALKTVKLELFRGGKSPFRWAVEEKVEVEELAETDRSLHGGQEVASQATQRTHGLIKLENVDIISSADHERIEAIDDIVFAFNQTLRRLVIDLRERPPFMLQDCLHLGQKWVHLSVLTHLGLGFNMSRLVIDPNLLAQCPNLSNVFIFDWTFRYKCQDIIPCSSANLANLQVLQLSGWSALTFHPETLSSTKQLTVLELTLQQADPNPSVYRGFIPPVTEVYRSYGIQGSPSFSSQTNSRAEEIDTDITAQRILRPQWTWDWHLPHLTRLVLESELGFLFQFKMLVGCPALEFLRLDIRSTARGSHTRVLTETDLLFIPGATQNDFSSSFSSSAATGTSTTSSSQVPTKEYIRLLSLRELDLFGPWAIKESTFHLLFVSVFPNLTTFALQEWHFDTFKSLFSLIKSGSILSKDDRKGRLAAHAANTTTTSTSSISHSGNSDNVNNEIPMVTIAPSTPSRAALSRLGWKFIGERNCKTKAEIAEATQNYKDMGVSFAYYMSSCFSVRVCVHPVCSNPGFGLFD